MTRVAVLGLGNVLRRDDGFGPSAVHRLERAWRLPPEVHVADLGTPGLDLASYLVGHDAVLVLDTALGDAAPGTLHVHRKEALLAGPGLDHRVTGHEGDLREAIAIADLAGGAPREVVLIGVVPEDLGDGTGLSPAVAAALEPACARAAEELRRLGLALAPRPAAALAGGWWE